MKYDLNLYDENGDYKTIESCSSLEEAKRKWAHFAMMRIEASTEEQPHYYLVEATYGDTEVDVSAYVFGGYEPEEEEE